MKVIKIISENKRTKRRQTESTFQMQLYQSKVGYAEVIVEEHGKLKTKHMVSLKNYANQT